MVKQMGKRLWMKSGNEKGMTLLELLAVIVILGVIAAIAVPAVSNIIANSKTDADEQSEKLMESAVLLYLEAENIDTGDNSVNISDVVSAGYLKSAPVKQSNGETYSSVAVTYSTSSGWTVGAFSTTAPSGS